LRDIGNLKSEQPSLLLKRKEIGKEFVMILKKEQLILVTAICAVIVLSGTPAFSDDKFVVRPKISVDSEMETNFYKAETDELH